MRVDHRLQRIVVVPRNGYVNRLQAWASAAMLGADLDVPVQVTWEPEPIAPAGAADIFDKAAVERSFIESAELTDVLGRPHAQMPRYLTIDAERRVATLAGHDRGEQAFMSPLTNAILTHPHPEILVIIAGGKFHLGNGVDAASRRAAFYAGIPWEQGIATRAADVRRDRGAFIGLHVRGTDRSVEAPTPYAIEHALADLRSRSGVTSLFIAADTATSRQAWVDTTRRAGFSPWTAEVERFDRGSVRAGQEALVDWIVLGCAVASVYSAESSFGEEAAVASGNPGASIPLRASRERQQWRRGSRIVRNAVTYPSRRWRRA